VLLCGDAAGAVDPISGEGIPYAMQTGKAAATAVATALSQPEGRTALEIYCEDYKDVVASLRRGKFWRWFVYPRGVERLFAWAFRCEPLKSWVLTGD
jgi:flavin-dependent dehydrogenase